MVLLVSCVGSQEVRWIRAKRYLSQPHECLGHGNCGSFSFIGALFIV